MDGCRPPAPLASRCPRDIASCAILRTAGWPASGRPPTSCSAAPVAVKVLASHLSEDDRARRRFEREARAAGGPLLAPARGDDLRRRRVRRPRLHGDGADAGRHRGRAPARKAARSPTRPRCAGCARPAGALDAAHDQGVVHRDIKPGNLLLDDRDRLAIADFGIARLALEDQLTATGQVLGTASYISPEQAVGEPATAASDRYALAVVAFELLTGSRPFQAEHFAAQARAHVEDEPPLATERDPSLPRGVDAVLDRGLAKDPGGPLAERRRDGRGARLARWAARGRRPSRRARSPYAAPAERAGGNAWPWVLAGLAALVVLAVAGACCSRATTAAASRRGRSRPPRRPRSAPPSATRTAEPTATPTARADRRRRRRRPRRPSQPAGGTDLDRAADLQLQGFNARARRRLRVGARASPPRRSRPAATRSSSTRAATRCTRSAPRSTRSAGRTRRSRTCSSGWTSTGPTRTSRRS